MISIKEVEDMAKLSRIKLSEEDKQSLVKDFDAILKYVDKLKAAKVSLGAETRVGAVKNVTREDVAQDTSAEDRERLLAVSPDREGDFIAVKKVIEQ